MRRASWLLLGVLGWLGSTAPAAAQTTTIDFEADTPGDKPNGFYSTQSPVVSFTDSIGAELAVGVFTESNNTRGLAVGGRDGSALILNFTTLVNTLRLDFGNDSLFNGDTATLQVFRDEVPVGLVNLAVNGNDAMDQTIAISGLSFNKAIFAYTQDGSPADGAEIIDNVVFTEGEAGPAVPEPSAALLFLPALATVAALRRRRG